MLEELSHGGGWTETMSLAWDSLGMGNEGACGFSLVTDMITARTITERTITGQCCRYPEFVIPSVHRGLNRTTMSLLTTFRYLAPTTKHCELYIANIYIASCLHYTNAISYFVRF